MNSAGIFDEYIALRNPGHTRVQRMESAESAESTESESAESEFPPAAQNGDSTTEESKVKENDPPTEESKESKAKEDEESKVNEEESASEDSTVPEKESTPPPNSGPGEESKEAESVPETGTIVLDDCDCDSPFPDLPALEIALESKTALRIALESKIYDPDWDCDAILVELDAPGSASRKAKCLNDLNKFSAEFYIRISE